LNNLDYTYIRDLVGQSRLIVVTSHHNPDGDAIGSAIAMASTLQLIGKDATVIVPNEYPSFLKWIPGNEKVMIFKLNEEKARDAISRADLIFCVDYNALYRTGAMEEVLRKSKAKKILIDHHPEPVLDDFDFYLSVIQTSSTSELIYRFLEGCSWLDLINQEVATGLFVGIMTDTGSFSFSCNYPSTFKIVAGLLQTGINAEKIHRLVYDTYSEDRLRLLGYCLSEKLIIMPEFHTAYISLSKAELSRFHHQVGDTEGIVNYALSIENIKLAVLLTERKDRIRLSFRSKGDFPVNRIARDHFGGGGHQNAAGGDSFISLEGTVKKLIEVLGQYKEVIDRSSI
jgi:bifunctional oligoribonuclease and PAP phosphatase NrnA